MKILYNFLNQDVINLARHEVDRFKLEARWVASQNFWQDVLLKNAVIGNVTHTPVSPHLTKLIIKILEPHVPRCREITIQHYLWHPLSGINMHDDGNHVFGATIYMTPEWDINWGGLFVYENKNNSLEVIFPTFNSLNINTSKTRHMVTTVSPLAPYPRYTLQIWGDL